MRTFRLHKKTGSFLAFFLAGIAGVAWSQFTVTLIFSVQGISPHELIYYLMTIPGFVFGLFGLKLFVEGG